MAESNQTFEEGPRTQFIAEMLISANELPIYQQVASNYPGVRILVSAKKGENYEKRSVDKLTGGERLWVGKVPDGKLYIAIHNDTPDLSNFWKDVRKLIPQPLQK